MIPCKPGPPWSLPCAVAVGKGSPRDFTTVGTRSCLTLPWGSFFSTPGPGSSGFKCFLRAVNSATYPDDIFENHVFTSHARFLVWPVLGSPLNGPLESVWTFLAGPRLTPAPPPPPWRASHENRSRIYGKPWELAFSPLGGKSSEWCWLLLPFCWPQSLQSADFFRRSKGAQPIGLRFFFYL